MSENRETVLAAVHDAGYDSVTPDGGYESASGAIPLPPAHRDEVHGWRRLLPRVYCGGSNPSLVPDDLRRAVERHDWVVQPMGRSAETVTVVVSREGV